MALNINGGTDHAYWTVAGTPAATGCFAFWMRTTQATGNTAVASYWGGSSRSGFGFILNSAANKISALGYDTTTQRVNLASTTSVNDGNPHHVAFNFNRASGGSNQLYIDGAQEASANSSAAWTSVLTGFFIQLGDPVDAFWATLIGDLWEVGYWTGAQLSADEIAALAKGYSSKLIRQESLLFHAPLVRHVADRESALTLNALVGTAAAAHGRVIGGAV